MSKQDLMSVGDTFAHGPECPTCGAVVTPREAMDEHITMCAENTTLRKRCGELRENLATFGKSHTDHADLHRSALTSQANYATAMARVRELEREVADAKRSILVREDSVRNEQSAIQDLRKQWEITRDGRHKAETDLAAANERILELQSMEYEAAQELTQVKDELEDMRAIAEKCLDPEYMEKLKKDEIVMAMAKRVKDAEAELEDVREQIAKVGIPAPTWQEASREELIMVLEKKDKAIGIAVEMARHLLSAKRTPQAAEVQMDSVTETVLAPALALTPEWAKEELARRDRESEKHGIIRSIERVRELGQTTMGSVIIELRLLSGESMEDICSRADKK